MKYLSSLIIVSFLFVQFISAQSSSQQQQDQGQHLAKKIAEKIKDSLNLTGTQMSQLYEINLLLHNQKKQMRASGLSRDSIGKGLQRIENTRDSLYKQIIPVEKFELYRTKKRRLVNNN